MAAAIARKLGAKLLLASVEEFRGLAMNDLGPFEALLTEKGATSRVKRPGCATPAP